MKSSLLSATTRKPMVHNHFLALALVLPLAVAMAAATITTAPKRPVSFIKLVPGPVKPTPGLSSVVSSSDFGEKASASYGAPSYLPGGDYYSGDRPYYGAGYDKGYGAGYGYGHGGYGTGPLYRGYGSAYGYGVGYNGADRPYGYGNNDGYGYGYADTRGYPYYPPAPVAVFFSRFGPCPTGPYNGGYNNGRYGYSSGYSSGYNGDANGGYKRARA